MKLAREVLDRIIEQAAAEAPNEACGYVAGRGDRGELVIPMRNVDASPEHFSLDPKEQFAALKKAREAGLDLLAVYHSHPATPARMSREDIRLAHDPSVVYLIYSVAERLLKGFRVGADRTVLEVPVEIDISRAQAPA